MIYNAVIRQGSREILFPVTMEPYQSNSGPRMRVRCKYNEQVIEKIKDFGGRTWDPEKKVWHFPLNQRNQFQLKVWQWRAMTKAERDANPTANPYYLYDQPVIKAPARRKIYPHQQEMVDEMLTRHFMLVAGEMGVGKSLAAIEAGESALRLWKEFNPEPRYDSDLVWYVGPTSGVKAIVREINKWSCEFVPRLLTYENMVKLWKNWEQNPLPIPVLIIFDEMSKLKTKGTQRSEAAMFFSDLVRDVHGMSGYIWGLTGTPSPKSPTDWWNLVETLWPGYFSEGDPKTFGYKLALTEMQQGMDGQRYPHRITWLDDSKKCTKCGQYEDHEIHRVLIPIQIPGSASKIHKFEPSENRVQQLYRRMRGMTLVKLKKDCLSLPQKIYERIPVQPTPEMLRAAKIVAAKCPTTIMKLTLLRELSDGFQYTTREAGEETCEYCQGKKWSVEMVPTKEIDPMAPYEPADYEEAKVDCPNCEGKGVIPKLERTLVDVGSPKDEVFINDLDEHDDIGRYIVWGGFTGTIDRLVAMAHKAGWATLRVDGRGFVATNADGSFADPDTFLSAMDGSDKRRAALEEQFPRICFVGHPQAGGMALTLTSSPTAMYFSNTFNGEARMQSEDRGHRAGMDPNRGFVIKDLLCLPTDQLVLDNLMKKKRLQSISLGEDIFDERLL